MARVMVCGPFSALMIAEDEGGFAFPGKDKQRIQSVHRVLAEAGHEVLSAHVADAYGERPWVKDFVARDLAWVDACDVQVVMLPAATGGEAVRSDGTMIEMGFAHARGKPIVLLADDLSDPSNSFFLRSFEAHLAASLPWTPEFAPALLESITEATCNSAPSNTRTRRQMTDVDAMLAELREDTKPHDVEVAGLSLHVLPGVLSPRLSHAPDALISKWRIPTGAKVLDLGCGSGVLGLAALRAGAAGLVALDINPQAVETTRINIERLGYSGKAEARLSNGYSALHAGERFDVVLFAAPYWDRSAKDDLDRSCFDGGYQFMAAALDDGHHWMAPNGVMYVLFSDQGDVGQVLRLIDRSRLRVDQMHTFRPTQLGGHIRIVWELRARCE